MDKMKRFSVLLVTAVTAVSLVSCGQATSSKLVLIQKSAQL